MIIFCRLAKMNLFVCAIEIKKKRLPESSPKPSVLKLKEIKNLDYPGPGTPETAPASQDLPENSAKS